MSLKSTLKSTVRKLGYDVVRYFPDEFLPPLDILPFFFKAYLKDLIAANPDFFVMQVGANDGKDMDPIRDAILAHHPRAILIEPLPDMFAQLRENYRGEPQLLFENAAIGERPGHLPFFRARPGTRERVWDVVASFNRTHLIRQGVPEELIEEVLVDVVTVPDLLAKHAIKHVNLLQVDAEGHDHRIVQAVLDAGLRPEIINYESGNLSTAQQTACKRMLFASGYHFIDVGIDTLCRLQEKESHDAAPQTEKIEAICGA